LCDELDVLIITDGCISNNSRQVNTAFVGWTSN